MGLRTSLTMFRARLPLRRANRQRHRELAAELANYASHADLHELYAVLKTYPDGQTTEIRQILCQQQAYRTWVASRSR